MLEDKDLQKLRQAAAENVNICMSIENFTDLLRFDIPEFSPITNKDILKKCLYGKFGDANLYVSPIVGSGNIRVSNLTQPITALSDLRKTGDHNVNKVIAENWSEEIAIATYGDK